MVLGKTRSNTPTNPLQKTKNYPTTRVKAMFWNYERSNCRVNCCCYWSMKPFPVKARRSTRAQDIASCLDRNSSVWTRLGDANILFEIQILEYRHTKSKADGLIWRRRKKFPDISKPNESVPQTIIMLKRTRSVLFARLLVLKLFLKNFAQAHASVWVS